MSGKVSTMSATSKAMRLLVGLSLAASLSLNAHAGRSCEQKLPGVREIDRAMTLADHVAKRLDESGAQVVVLARAGQDLSKYRLRWSHLGLAYKDGQAWRVVHKLNHCGSAVAALYRQGLGEFFLDDLYEYEAAYAVFKPEVQTRLLRVLQDNQRVAAMHVPAYNMVAYPGALTYQQSNQWVIETLAMSQSDAVTKREWAQAWLTVKGYEPTVLRISPMERLGARLTAANIAFDDHPNEKRYSGRIETVGADSVFEWLARSGLASSPVFVR